MRDILKHITQDQYLKTKALVNEYEQGVFPSFEEGWPRRSSKGNATLGSARAGEVKHSCNKMYDLSWCCALLRLRCAPRCACLR